MPPRPADAAVLRGHEKVRRAVPLVSVQSHHAFLLKAPDEESAQRARELIYQRNVLWLVPD